MTREYSDRPNHARRGAAQSLPAASRPEAPDPPVSFQRARLGALLGKVRETSSAVEGFFAGGPLRRYVWQLARSMEMHRAGRNANAMAFDLFLALLPMLALAGWALTHFVTAGEESLRANSLLADLTPDELSGIIRTHFESLSAATLAPVAAISGWWLASSAFHTMIGVFEEAFDCPRRPWWKSRLLALGYALVGMIVLVLSSVLGMTLTTPPGLLGELMVQLRAHGLLRHALVFVGLSVMTAFFALLYGIAIQRPGVRRRIWPGATLAAGLGASASFLFGYYAPQVARFALFYGGLAAVAILLVWLWVWCVALLLGAELNVLLEDDEHRRRSEA